MQGYSGFSDWELIGLLKKAQVGAFTEIYNRYWDKIGAAVYKRTGSREVTEEIVQDIFTAFWLKRESLTIKTSLNAYLMTAAKYRVINHFHKEMVRKAYKNTVEAERPNIDNSTEEMVLLNDLHDNIEKQIIHLPPRCRQVYELSRKKLKTNKEIAREMAISEKTVENQLTKALKTLKVGLRDAVSYLFFIF